MGERSVSAIRELQFPWTCHSVGRTNCRIIVGAASTSLLISPFFSDHADRLWTGICSSYSGCITMTPKIRGNKWPFLTCVDSFFFFILFIFIFYFLTLQYCIGFAIYQNKSTTGIHVFPILKPPPSSLPIPSLWVVPVHQPQASSIMCRTWTGDLFHIWYLYMLQCHSPKSSHPLPLPQSPEDCSIHQCLFCCLVHRKITRTNQWL